MVFGSVLSLTTTLSLACIYDPRQCPNNGTTTAIPPPQITYGPANQTIIQHETAILPCQFAPTSPGQDPPTLNWYHDGRLVGRDDDRLTISPSGTLKITDLRKSDSGNYTCQVNSLTGYDQASGFLQVEEHTNPDAVFVRMADRAQLPAAPSQPRVSVKKPNQIDIEWDPPANHGASPVTHYTLQYWNPVPGQKTTWTTVNDRINGLKYRLVGVQPSQQYFFIVRANNALGMGEPSPMSAMAYTYADPERADPASASETSVQLQKPVRLTQAKSINASSALLTWSNGEGLQNDGFYLTWRGPPLANGDTIMNITEPKVSSVVVNGLQPFSTYDFFLIPYKAQRNLSPSNSIELRTPEGVPDPPRNVFARMENLTSVMISFAPPLDVRGVLRGFDIRFMDNSSSYENTIRTKANARSVTLRNLRPNGGYQAHIATLSGGGRSDFVSTEFFVMNEATLHRHQQLYGRPDEGVSAWKIGAGAGFLALFLALGALLAFCWCRYAGGKKGRKARHRAPSTEFVKISDGSVATAQDYYPEPLFQLPPPPPLQQQQQMAHLAQSPHAAHYFSHAHAHHQACVCCTAAVMNAYGTTMRQPAAHHYSGPYHAGASTLGREEGQYHYAVLPTGTLPHNPQQHGLVMHYEDDPSPYASTTVTSNGYGPVPPSNPIPPPPPMFAPIQLQHKLGPNPTGSVRRTATVASSGSLVTPAHCHLVNTLALQQQHQRQQQTQPGRRTPRTNPHFFEPPAPAPQERNGDLELGRILAQVPPPPVQQQQQTYDSVTDDFLTVPNYRENDENLDGTDPEERAKDLPNRVTNSRSPPRTRNGMNDHEELYLLN